MYVIIGSNSSSSSHYGSHRATTDSTTRRPTHGLGARHELVLKNLPFYDVLAEIMKPSSLGMSKSNFIVNPVLTFISSLCDLCIVWPYCTALLTGYTSITYFGESILHCCTLMSGTVSPNSWDRLTYTAAFKFRLKLHFLNILFSSCLSLLFTVFYWLYYSRLVQLSVVWHKLVVFLPDWLIDYYYHYYLFVLKVHLKNI